ncbi:amidase family protein [Spirillospora sp. NPDC049652]
MDDPARWGLAEAAARIRDGTISSAEYTQELLRRCRSWQGLNAFTSLGPETALRQARQADRLRARQPGPLHGIPLAVKDNIDVAGQATTGGTPALRGQVVRRDAEVWTSLRAAGAFSLGKTNMHELAFGITGNNQAFGPALNPWAADRTAGGSSGGTASAVAACLVPAGLGTDTGGSIRIPAAHCGVVGLRPSRGRYGQHGVLLLSRTRDTVGLIARSVQDVALLDSVITSPLGDRTGAGVPPASWSGVRLGVPRAPFWRDLDSGTEAVARRRLDDLRRAGAVLVRTDLPAPVTEQTSQAGLAVALYEALRELPRYLAQTTPAPTLEELIDQVAGPDVRALLDDAKQVTESDYRTACHSTVPRISSALAGHLRALGLDALVYPTCPLPAQPVGHDETVLLNGRRVPAFATCIRNTDLASVIGWPALSLPAGLTDDGLPVGLELCGAPGTDRRLLSLARGGEQLWERPPKPGPPPDSPSGTCHACTMP